MDGLHWVVTDNAPVRVEPGRGRAIASLPKFARVNVLDDVTALYRNMMTRFARIEVNGKHGFVYAGYLEPYKDAFRRNVVTILNGTLNPQDAEQYLVWNGKTQYNPFGNKLEGYEWEQVVESGGAPYGIVVPR